MRFSLATLVLVTLWAGALIPVYLWRFPWQRIEEVELPVFQMLYSELKSPDQLRICVPINREFVEWRIVDSKTRSDLATLPVFEDRMLITQFIDDDTLEFEPISYGPDDDVIVLGKLIKKMRLRRRFPEWWWGHFYRPEVWCAIVLTAVLTWRFAKRQKISKQNLSESRSL